MRVVIDINILVSALIVPTGQPAAVIKMQLDGKFYAADLRDSHHRAASHAAQAEDRCADRAT
jgi:hypothetical protein